MRKPFLLAALAAACLSISLAASQVLAQGPAPVRPAARPAGGSTIALLDVSYIFQKLPRFKQMMTQLKDDIDRAEGQVKAERDAIKKLMEKLERFKGTADYKRLEEEVTTRQVNLGAQVNLQKKDFLLREARIYHNVYKEIQDEADYYCTNNGIDMVLRFDGDPVDVEQPDSVLRYINRQVVWYARERDITPYILKRLEERDPRGTGAAPADTRGRSGPVTLPIPR